MWKTSGKNLWSLRFDDGQVREEGASFPMRDDVETSIFGLPIDSPTSFGAFLPVDLFVVAAIL